MNPKWIAAQTAMVWFVIGALLISSGFVVAGVFALLSGVATFVGVA